MLAFALPLAAGQCRTLDADGAQLCPAHLPPVRAVRVSRTRQHAWTDAGEPCRRFAPTAADVRRFLARAERTDRRSLHYALPESPCFVSGTVRFGNGQSARFRLDRYATMRLRLGSHEVLLHCPACRFGGLDP